MTPPESASSRRPLLAEVAGMVLLLLPLMALFLFGSGWVQTSRQPAEGPVPVKSGQAADRYLPARLWGALKSFEHGIVAARPELQTPAGDALVPQVPQCRNADWSKDDRERLVKLQDHLAAINRRPRRPMASPVTLDVAAWSRELADRIDKPIVGLGSKGGEHLKLRCDDIRDAVRQLVRNDGALLDQLVWRDTTPKSLVKMWRPEQIVAVPAEAVARYNPWRGLPGCVFLGDRNGIVSYVVDGAGRRRPECELPAIAVKRAPDDKKALEFRPLAKGVPSAKRLEDPRWRVPPDLTDLLAPVAAIRMPSSALFRRYTDGDPTGSGRYSYGANQLDLAGRDVTIGFSVDVGIQPETQALAQQVAACYTGNQDVCDALGIRRPEDGNNPVGHNLLEQALVRMAGIAIIDVASGRIEALAGAFSRCGRQSYGGPALDANCDHRLPYRPAYRPDLLKNPAAFHDAMPASTIKPIMAAAFLADGVYGERLVREAAQAGANLSPLQRELMTSNSRAFLDRMFCAEKGYRDCRRPWAVQQAASALGWNGACNPGHATCGQSDLLFGAAIGKAPADAAQLVWLPRFFGRLMVERGSNDTLDFVPILSATSGISEQGARTCAGTRWSNCKGEALVNLVAEGWGQGNARATPVGVAGIMARLAAAANGLTAVPRPHLVEQVRGVNGALQLGVDRAGLDGPVAPGIPPAHARIILGGLGHSHRPGGTAAAACHQVFGAAACNSADWIAGKTGTPSFPNDRMSLDQLAKLCSKPAGARKELPINCANLRPYKWYTATYRLNDGAGWQKTIAVLTERNWYSGSGMVHGAGDSGPNPAAEIAFQVVKRQRLTGGKR